MLVFGKLHNVDELAASNSNSYSGVKQLLVFTSKDKLEDYENQLQHGDEIPFADYGAILVFRFLLKSTGRIEALLRDGTDGKLLYMEPDSFSSYESAVTAMLTHSGEILQRRLQDCIKESFATEKKQKKRL